MSWLHDVFVWGQVLLLVAGLIGLIASLRDHSVRAIFKRNVQSYFAGVLGYVVIVAFVVAGGFLAFDRTFFTNNLANLDQLSDRFPLLLLFLVPAITMNIWSDEKKLGTEELLFTLPARDLEILVGKYLAALAVYTVALVFSLAHLVVLAYIGDPDWGVVFTTYCGYWFAGAALLSAGMFASVLTNSATVAFVLGTVICAIPVFIGHLSSENVFIRALSLPEQFRDFQLGMLPLSGIAYFMSFTVLMLYLNLVFITKRHWSGTQQTNMGLQFTIRTLCTAVILIGVNMVAANATSRADFTSENLYTLSPTTEKLVENIEKDHPITIQAFLSPDVPREYVPIRKQLIGLLRQYDQLGGSRIEVRFVKVERFSDEAEEAQLLGIKAVPVQSERDGRQYQDNIYLGAVVSSGYDEIIIPFFGAGSLAEYELTRSISTASNEKRLKVGVLKTDANILNDSNEWRIITELRKQYDVDDVSPKSAINADDYDVLFAVLPSSLTAPEMKNLVDYVKAGHPTFICDDPLPLAFSSMFGVSNAPSQPKPSPGGRGMGGMRSPPPEQKADNGKATSLINALNIAWNNGQIVWDKFNPHPVFGDLPPSYLFIKPREEIRGAFSVDSPITNGLQEMLAAYAGHIQPRPGDDTHFEPLLRIGTNSGILDWDQFTTDGFDFQRMQPTAQLTPLPSTPGAKDPDAHVIAAHITGKNDKQLNVVYVADLDLISDWFFAQRDRVDVQRERGEPELNLDNVSFTLNAVDVLAGEDSYLDLRKRRSTSRTLKKVEEQTAKFINERTREEQDATKQADKNFDAAKARFAAERTKLQEDKSLDARTRDILLRNMKENEDRRLEVFEAKVERAKQESIGQIKAKTEQEIRKTEERIQMFAVSIPAIPAILLGVFIFFSRLSNERRGISSDRLVKK